ncbi:MAG: DEAD/DEAH box helicase, partial [Promethearchaeota archaeon]
IQSGAQIVVATPGRLIDIYNRKRISFKHVKYVVLDEADRCLDMGFMPDIEFILLEAMKHVHPQLMLFSATMFTQVIELAQRFTKGKNIIEVNVSQDQLTVDNCDQFYYLINNFKDKYYDFVRILRQEKPTHSMIFVNTKKTGEWLYNRLSEESKLNLKIELISGNLSQKRREIVLKKFKSKKINCLIATDVAARGLDIQKVSHVFNYDIPEFEENYVHRIGRTARVFGGDHHIEKGTAISLVLADQMRIMGRIEAFMDKNIKQRPLPQRQGSNRQNYPNSGRQYNNGNGNYRSYNNRSNTNNPNQRNNQRRSPYPSNSPRNGPRRSDDPRNKLERSKDEKSKKEKPDPKRRNFLY